MVIALLLLATPPTGEGQGAGRGARIGLLCGVRCEGPAYDSLRLGLRELGWIEGQNLVVEVRGAQGHWERLPLLAAELVTLKVDLVVAVAPGPSRVAKDATSTIPIVIIAVADPVAVGLAESLARPGGNVTGLSTLVPGGFMTKSLELLKEAVPNASRIAVFWNSRNEVHQRVVPAELPVAAQALDLRLQMLDIQQPTEIEAAFDAAVHEHAQALLVVGDPIFHTPAPRLPELAARSGLPAMYLVRDLVRAGGLMSYGPDFLHMFRRAATYVDRLLKGARPAALPIEQPTKFQLVINLKTAKALGLTIPQAVLLQADEIIQ